MKADQLRSCLDREVGTWCQKDYPTLLKELRDEVTYEGNEGQAKYQVEIQLIERESDYLHVMVSVDDGSFWRSCKPLTHSFLVYRDGRVEG